MKHAAAAILLLFACACARAQEIHPPWEPKRMLDAIVGVGDIPGATIVERTSDEQSARIVFRTERCEKITVSLLWCIDSGDRFVTGGVSMSPTGSSIQDLERGEENGLMVLAYRYRTPRPYRSATRAALFDAVTKIEVSSVIDRESIRARERAEGLTSGSLSVETHKAVLKRDIELVIKLYERHGQTGVYDHISLDDVDDAGNATGGGTPGTGAGGSGAGTTGGGSTGTDRATAPPADTDRKAPWGGGGNVTTERAAAAAGAIALILIASGVSVNVANAIADALRRAAEAAAEAAADAGDTPPPPPPPPLKDTYGNTLEQDGDQYWWYDRWVSHQEAQRLIAEEQAERDAAAAPFLEAHARRAEEDWNELRRRSHGPDAGQVRQARHAAMMAEFERLASQAQDWLERYDPSYIGRIDRIRDRIMARGYPTAQDLADMARLTGESWLWMQRDNARNQQEWNEIRGGIEAVGEGVQNAAWEVGKTAAAAAAAASSGGASVVAAGAVAALQSAHRGDSFGQAVENVVLSGTFNAGEIRVAAALGGRPVAAMGAGTLSGATEAFIRSRGDAWATAQGAGFGFVGAAGNALGRSADAAGGGKVPVIRGDDLVDAGTGSRWGRTAGGVEAPSGRTATSGASHAAAGAVQDAPEIKTPRISESGDDAGLLGGPPSKPPGSGDTPELPTRARTPEPAPDAVKPQPRTRLEGEPVPGPTTPEAADAWQRTNADAHGRIYDRHGNQIATISPDGDVTSLNGRPARILQDPDGLNVGIEEPTPSLGGARRDVEFDNRGRPHETRPRDAGGPRRQLEGDAYGERLGIDDPRDNARTLTPIEGEDIPTPDRAVLPSKPEVRAAWRGAGAGPRGELYGLDGRQIGAIDHFGRKTAVIDGRTVEITGHGMPQNGRLPWFKVNDNGVDRWFRGDGTPTTPAEIRAQFGRTPSGRPLPTPAEQAEAIDAARRAAREAKEGQAIADMKHEARSVRERARLSRGAREAQEARTTAETRRVTPYGEDDPPPPGGGDVGLNDAPGGAGGGAAAVEPTVPGQVDMPNPRTPEQIAQQAAINPIVQHAGGRVVEGVPEGVTFVQQREGMDCVVACAAMASDRPYASAADALRPHRTTFEIHGETLYEGVPPRNIPAALESVGLNPERVRPALAGSDAADVIGPRLAGGEKIVARMPGLDHGVVLDHAWQDAAGQWQVRVLDPRGIVYEVPLRRAEWQQVFDWHHSYFVGGAA